MRKSNLSTRIAQSSCSSNAHNDKPLRQQCPSKANANTPYSDYMAWGWSGQELLTLLLAAAPNVLQMLTGAPYLMHSTAAWFKFCAKVSNFSLLSECLISAFIMSLKGAMNLELLR